MRSSIFSFDRAAIEHAAIGVAAAAIVALLLFAGVELYWRSVGARSSYVDGHARWSAVRETAERSDHPRRTVIMGASRILFAFSLSTFEERHSGIPIAQLAIPAKGPLATLEHFAYETDFDGVILFDLDPENILPPREPDQADYVEYYATRWGLDHRVNFQIANEFEPFVISRQYTYGVNQLVRDVLRTGSLPMGPLYLTITAGRQHNADFLLTDGAQLANNRFADLKRRHDELLLIADRVWPSTARRLAAAVAAIHSRSGCVVLIRMPIVGQWLEQDQRVFADPKYWEELLPQLGVYGVHYSEIDGIEEIPLPDSQHVDMRDQSRFTHALIDELDRIGIYAEGSSCRP